MRRRWRLSDVLRVVTLGGLGWVNGVIDEAVSVSPLVTLSRGVDGDKMEWSAKYILIWRD